MMKKNVTSQLKGQDKIPEKQLNEVGIGDLPGKQSRIMIVDMTQDLRNRVEAKTEKMREMSTKDLKELRNKQTEMSTTLGGIHSRITEAEVWINDLENRMVEITAAKQNIEKKNKKK